MAGTKNGVPVLEDETDTPLLWISIPDPCAMNFVSSANSSLLLTTNN